MRAAWTTTLFRVAAIAEAISWTGLLVGMLFKHVVSDDPRGVEIFGPIHGGLFIAYLATVALVRPARGWDERTTLLAMAAAVPPLASVVFERWATRKGRLG